MDGFAFGPQSTELSHILLDSPVDALLIERGERNVK
jgi:hypothetical protein